MSSVETKTIGSVESMGTENILIFLTKFGSFKEDTIKVYFFFFLKVCVQNMSCKVALSNFQFPVKRYLCLKLWSKGVKGDPLGPKGLCHKEKCINLMYFTNLCLS